MIVKDVMATEVITVRRSTTLRHLLQTFSKFHMFPLVPVIEEDNRLVGIVSFRNLIGVFLPHRPGIFKTIPFLDDEREDIFKSDLTQEIGDLIVVEDIMEKKFLSIQDDTSLEQAYNLMKLHLSEQLPVIDKSERLAGMVGIFDIIGEIFRQKGIV